MPASQNSTYAHLPEWATWTCDDCGEYFLPGFGSTWSNRRPSIRTHGGLRRRVAQAAALQHLPVQTILLYQAIVEASQTLGHMLGATGEDDLSDAAAKAIFSAIASLKDAVVAAHKLGVPA